MTKIAFEIDFGDIGVYKAHQKSHSVELTNQRIALSWDASVFCVNLAEVFNES